MSAVLQAPRTFQWKATRHPDLGPNQVRVRMQGCGVCGSNLPVWEGRPWFSYPLQPGAPGHEGWGVVDAIGEQVQSVAVGTRISCLTWNAFATHDVAEECNVVPLPAELDPFPFPGEPLACAVNAFRRSLIRPGERVVIVGVGFLGALLVQLASSHGGRVIAVSRRAFARKIAAECGAQVALPLSDKTAAAINEATSGDGVDCVIEATGMQQSLDLATEVVRVRGRIVVAGYHQDGKRQIDMQQWNWKGLDVVNAHERDSARYIAGMRDAVQEVVAGRLRLPMLLTHEFESAEIERAFEVAIQRPEGFLKSLVVFPTC